MRELEQLYDTMVRLGETAMGDLTPIQAALFHNATAIIGDLLDCLGAKYGESYQEQDNNG